MKNILKNSDHHPDNLWGLKYKLGVDLNVIGEILPRDVKSIAVIGTRKPSLYGIEITKAIVTEAVNRGFTIVSGLARGIDTEAHRAALSAGGRTIAVLGSGLENIYPEENVAIAHEISEKGAVISQFPSDTPPLRKNFPMRNKVVARMSTKIILIEAPVKSGALITCRLANDAGKDIYILPGRLGDEGFSGNFRFFNKHKYSKNVHLVSEVSDIFKPPHRDVIQTSIFDVVQKNPPPQLDLSALSNSEKIIAKVLQDSDSPLFFDKIVVESGFSPKELSSLLLMLTINGVVKELSGKNYTLV